jgi:hypothetical protein
MIKDQDILGSEEAMKKFLTMVPEEKLRNTLEKAMLNYHDSASRWRVFEELTANTNKSTKVREILRLLTR